MSLTSLQLDDLRSKCEAEIRSGDLAGASQTLGKISSSFVFSLIEPERVRIVQNLNRQLGVAQLVSVASMAISRNDLETVTQSIEKARVLGLSPGDLCFEAYYELFARIVVEKGNEPFVDNWIEAGHSEWPIYSAIAKAFARNGKPDKALETLRKLQEKDDLFLLGKELCHISIGQRDQSSFLLFAQEILKVPLFPLDSPEIGKMLGDFVKDMLGNGWALDIIISSVLILPFTPDQKAGAFSELCRQLVASNQLDQAFAVAERTGMESATTTLHILQHQSKVYLKEQNFQKILDLCDCSSLKSLPAKTQNDFLFWVFDCLYANGRDEEALAVLKKIRGEDNRERVQEQLVKIKTRQQAWDEAFQASEEIQDLSAQGYAQQKIIDHMFFIGGGSAGKGVENLDLQRQAYARVLKIRKEGIKNICSPISQRSSGVPLKCLPNRPRC